MRCRPTRCASSCARDSSAGVGQAGAEAPVEPAASAGEAPAPDEVGPLTEVPEAGEGEAPPQEGEATPQEGEATPAAMTEAESASGPPDAAGEAGAEGDSRGEGEGEP